MALLILFLINILNFYDRLTLGAITEPLNREFHLSDTRIGLLSTGFTVIYGLAGLPLGRLADTSSRRRLLAAGVTAWAALTGLGGLAAGYAMLLATRLGVGIGEAVCAPAAVSWIGDAVPPRRRARAMAVFMMAVPLGVMLSFSIGGPVAQAYGWRAALALAAAPAAILVPAILWLKEPKRSAVSAAGASSPRALLRIRAFWWIAASGAVVNFALYSLTVFFPAFLIRFHHLSIARAGVWAGVGLGAAGILGALAAAALGDRLHGNQGRARMRLAAAASLAAAPAALVAIAAPAGEIALAVSTMMLAYGLLQMYYGLVYAAMQDVVPANLRGAAMGGYFVVQYLGGAAWGPLLTGHLSDRFARAAANAGLLTEAARAAGLHRAMYVIPALALALAAVLWAGAQSIVSDRAGAGLVS